MTGTSGGGAMGAGEAQTEIRRLQGAAFRDPVHPLMDKLHPEHRSQVERLRRLYRIAFPG